MNLPDNNSPKNYKPGPYIGTCFGCGHTYLGPKRSFYCAECASKHNQREGVNENPESP